MSAPKKIYYDDFAGTVNREWMVGDTTYIRADIVDELVEAFKFAWPIIEHERYKWDGSYGRNFDQAKADRARQAFEKIRAALAKARGES